MPKVTTFLTFEKNGEEAVRFYVSLFPNSKIHAIERYPEDGMLPKGSLMHASFELDGQAFMAMDGGPHFQFAQGFSLHVSCDTQAEIDHLWDRLAEGGEEQMCGWVQDRFGISWQIIPPVLGQLLTDPDRDKAQRTLKAMLGMKKLDIAALERAHAGEGAPA